MASSKNLVVILTLFLSLIAANANRSLREPPSKLVKKLCNGHSIQNRRFCLSALSNPQAAAAKDAKQLTNVMMKLAMADSRKMLSLINDLAKKQPSSAKALKTCIDVYQFAIQSFGMIYDEMIEDPQTANYDISIIGPRADDCEVTLVAAKIHDHRISLGNQFLHYYSNMGSAITDSV